MASPVKRAVAQRLERTGSVDGPNPTLMRLAAPFWRVVSDLYFRAEFAGWEKLPDRPSLVVSVHGGAALPVDGMVFAAAWYRHFDNRRVLNTAVHDVLMATPGLGDYFSASGGIPASPETVSAALDAGHDVLVFPGGEQDAMRSFRRRDEVVLAGRRGFVKQAMTSGVPIVPVASVGGGDTVFVLSEGRWLTKALDKVGGIAKRLRAATFPIVAGVPFGVHPEALPAHIPLPAKLRFEVLDPISVAGDPDDDARVDAGYEQVRDALQAGVDRLAGKRRLPVWG